MRAFFAILIFALGLVGHDAADAADYLRGGSGAVGHYSEPVVRAPQLLIYDDQPGVIVRPYWITPWGNRHYYPFTGKKPKVGRHERLNAKYPAPKPAESYYREWSTIALDPPVRPVYVSPPRRIYPPAESFGPLK